MNNSNLATFILLLLSTICGVITISLFLWWSVYKDDTLIHKLILFFSSMCLLFRLTGVLNQYFENK